jgi:hypothetical protein
MKPHLLCLLATLAVPTTTQAQVAHMNQQTKLEAFALFMDGAAKLAGEGKPAEARFICLTGVLVVKDEFRIPRWAERNKAVLERFDQICDPLWKGHKGDAAGSAAVLARHRDALKEYGRTLGFPPFGRADTRAGYDTHKRTVDAVQVAGQAFALATRFVDELPAPGELLKARPAGFDEMSQSLAAIATGRSLAPRVAETEALPAIRAELKKLDGRIDLSGAPGEMLSRADELGRWLDLLRALQPKDAEVAAYTARIATVLETAEKKRAELVASERMPKNAYKGGDRDAVIADLTAAYRRKFPSEKVLRVVIASDAWGPARGEGWWEGGVWKWSVFSRIVDVAFAVETKAKGKSTPLYHVYRISFGREKVGDGWGKPYVLATGWARPILRENIDK